MVWPIPIFRLDCWGPVLNLARDPRWGRNGESGSEDPYLTSQFSLGYTLGFQNGTAADLPGRFLRGIVTLKHWDANTLESSDGFTRHSFNANVSNFVLQDSYLPAFRTAIREGGARGIMCAYNSVQGVPSCSSKTLAAVLDGWGYKGYTTSDTDAVADSYKPAAHHHWANASEACCRSITDGRCDINSGNTYGGHLLDGVAGELCSIGDVDVSVARTLKQRFDLGLFDPAATQPLTKLGPESIATPAFAALNLRNAEESLVLLANRGKLLPLRLGTKVAVIGPLGDNPVPLLGTHYKGYACPEDTHDCLVSVFGAVGAINNGSGGATSYAKGCELERDSPDDLAAAMAAAKAADVVVLVLGIDGSMENEAHDRTSIDLPLAQHHLSEAIYQLGGPVVVVLINGGAVSIAPEMDTSGRLKQLAIVEAMLPGARGAEAIANGLFGRHGFGGRLPYSIYPAGFVNTTAMSEMDPTVPPGRTYRYREHDSFLYPFGTGLSLSAVALSLAGGPDAGTVRADGSNSTAVEVKIANAAGSPPVSQVITAFWRPVDALSATIPARVQLFDFARIEVAGGATVAVTFAVAAEHFHTADVATGDLVVQPGRYMLDFTDGAGGNVTTSVTVVGPKVVVEAFPSP